MFFERQEGGNLAVLVHVNFPHSDQQEHTSEFIELAQAAGAEVLSLVTANRDQPNAKYFIGTGKLEELQEIIQAQGADVVLFNHSLKPSQERNLERALECRVLDRTGLILDIFAQRARTYEGKLQVELAQLEYLTTRLVRGWTHLERQKGGIGLRGPGETQLETDRRLIRQRISSIQKRLARVRSQRDNSRRGRQQAEIPTLALVGYTNAGKSTLFNALTQAQVFAADQLFATLDPTLRYLELQDIQKVILADTVGFIRHLPHKLIEAFQATLQEAVQADLLIHVIDAADAERDDHIFQVEEVLHEIGAAEIPVLQVMNKIDLLEQEPRLELNAEGEVERVWLAAETGAGCDLLLEALNKRLVPNLIQGVLEVQPAQAQLRAELYNLKAVEDEKTTPEGVALLSVRLSSKDFNQLLARLKIQQNSLHWRTNP